MQAGQRIGPYEVVRELGRGAMGVVFEVRPAEPRAGASGRLALKLLLDPEPDFAARFAREVRVQQFLGRHRHVLPCVDAGQHGANPYLVMPLAQGGTLEDRIRAGAPLATTAALLIQTARAAHFAHEADIVHRDIKPANVLIGPDGGALLADFGVARSLTGERLTQTGALIGSPATMAPEQADGTAVDRRTDVYALGATLYQALTGRLPFDASTVVEWVRKILDEEPIAPRAVRPELPPALEAVCLKAMAKRPVDRYPTAEAFAAALEGALTGQARAPAAGRRRAAPLAAAALGLLAGAGLGFTIGGASEEPAAPVAPGAPPPVARSDEPEHATPSPLEQAASSLAIGDDEAALQLLLDALASLEPSASAGERLAWVLLAHGIDELRLLEEGGERAADALEEVAFAVLSATGPEDERRAPSVARARAWLELARLCAPERSLRTATEELRRLGDSPRSTLRLAARPWRRGLEAEEVDELFRKETYPPNVRARVVCNLAHEIHPDRPRDTWPAGWAALLHAASSDQPGQLKALLREALLWHPELSFLWVEPALHQLPFVGARETRELTVAAQLERSLEAHYWQNHARRVVGPREAAGEAALALQNVITQQGLDYRPWDWNAIAFGLLASPVVEHVRAGLRIVEDPRYARSFSDRPAQAQTLALQALARETLGEDEEAARLAAAAREHRRRATLPSR